MKKEMTLKEFASLGGKARWKGKTKEQIRKQMSENGKKNKGKKRTKVIHITSLHD